MVSDESLEVQTVPVFITIVFPKPSVLGGRDGGKEAGGKEEMREEGQDGGKERGRREGRGQGVVERKATFMVL